MALFSDILFQHFFQFSFIIFISWCKILEIAELS